jgi:hypothetical protein
LIFKVANIQFNFYFAILENKKQFPCFTTIFKDLPSQNPFLKKTEYRTHSLKSILSLIALVLSYCNAFYYSMEKSIMGLTNALPSAELPLPKK